VYHKCEDFVCPLIGGENIRVLAIQTEETECGLLLDRVLHLTVRKKKKKKPFCYPLFASKSLNTSQREASGRQWQGSQTSHGLRSMQWQTRPDRC